MARAPLSKERVLRAAVTLADDIGIEALSMRKLAQTLGVVPMALYKHVTNKDELLDGMVDAIIAEIDPPALGTDWKSAVRLRILSARQALLRHRWASQVIESRNTPTPAVLDYLDSMVGLFRGGGLSIDLTHHVMHAMGSRILGFSQELFDDTQPENPEQQAAAIAAMAQRYPYLTEIAIAASHTEDSVVGSGCDDQFEFEFALDLLLNGIERLQHAAQAKAAPRAPAQ